MSSQKHPSHSGAPRQYGSHAQPSKLIGQESARELTAAIYVIPFVE
jgi:hypothetical protein